MVDQIFSHKYLSLSGEPSPPDVGHVGGLSIPPSALFQLPGQHPLACNCLGPLIQAAQPVDEAQAVRPEDGGGEGPRVVGAGRRVRRARVARRRAQVQQSIARGTDIRAYCYWSLRDNFEGAEGYRARFGIFRINCETMARQETADIWKSRSEDVCVYSVGGWEGAASPTPGVTCPASS